MKSTANNHMVYAGTVKLSQRIGKQTFEVAKLDNAGGAALFDFLSDCLAGNFDSALVKRPVKIRLLSEDQENPGTFKGENSGFIYLSTLPEKSTATHEKGVVRYSFLITKEQYGGGFDHVGLYAAGATDNDINNYAAVVAIPEDARSVFSTSTDAIASAMVVDWELNISNKENA